MDKYNELLIQTYRNSSLLNTNINLTKIGILLFVFVFSIIKSFVFSTMIEVLLLLFISLLLISFNKLVIYSNGIHLSRVEILWILFSMLLVVNITINNLITSLTIIDVLIYASCVIFMILVKVDIGYYNHSLKLIKLLGVVYALSAIFQYYYTDVYLSYIFPLFTISSQNSILELLRYNSYTGFTNQTAHLAGYIVSGIGVIIFSSWKDKLLIRVISIANLAVLFTGLLLASKRAHFLFMIFSLIITIVCSINNKAFLKQIVKFTTVIITLIILAILLFNIINFREDSAIVNFVNELENTFTEAIAGEDVTSGRSVLFAYSWELFKENPIFGIGWKEFINNSKGFINSDRGSHPHNIYLQLLTELGIIGFLLFVMPVSFVYYKTYRMLRKIIYRDNLFPKWKFGIQFSFYSQTFFILYGLTGNLLTDYNFLLMYFFACSISLSATFYLKFRDN